MGVEVGLKVGALYGIDYHWEILPPAYEHDPEVLESFIEELAHAAGKDSYEYRRELISRNDFLFKDDWLQALDLVAEMSEWGTPLPEGWARGIAIDDRRYDREKPDVCTIAAMVCTVSVSKAGAVRLERVDVAFDDDGRVAVGCGEGAKREPSASGGVAVGILQCECIGVLLSGLEISQRNRVFGCSVRTLYDSGCSVVLTDVFELDFHSLVGGHFDARALVTNCHGDGSSEDDRWIFIGFIKRGKRLIVTASRWVVIGVTRAHSVMILTTLR